MATRSPGLYSRIVRALKLGLPIAAMSLLAAVFLVSREDELEGGLTFSKADLEAMGTGLRVTNPNFSGSSTRGDLYDFVAASVVPQDLGMKVATIADLSGTIRFFGGNMLELIASEADFDMENQKMVLNSGVELQTSDGYTASAGQVAVDLAQGVLTGTGTVQASGPMGKIEADRMNMSSVTRLGLESDAVVTFTGHVRLRYIPNVTEQQ